MSEGQATALDATVRYLNRRGYAWTDNHLQNFRFTAIDEAADQWRVDIIDTGGIFRMRGETPVQRFRNARAVQRLFNNPPAGFLDDFRATDRALNEAIARNDPDAAALRLARIDDLTSEAIDYDATFEGSQSGQYLVGAPHGTARHDGFRTLSARAPDEADAAYRAHYGEAPPLVAPTQAR